MISNMISNAIVRLKKQESLEAYELGKLNAFEHVLDLMKIKEKEENK